MATNICGRSLRRDDLGASGPLQRHAAQLSTAKYRTTRITTGATWLSRRPTTSVPLTVDLTGLFHPLLERKQVRFDGRLDYREDQGDLFSGTTWLWRAKATIGLSSSLQAALYGGGLHAGTFKSSELASLGSTLTFRLD
jgi:hypothetical protein